MTRFRLLSVVVLAVAAFGGGYAIAEATQGGDNTVALGSSAVKFEARVAPALEPSGTLPALARRVRRPTTPAQSVDTTPAPTNRTSPAPVSRPPVQQPQPSKPQPQPQDDGQAFDDSG